MLCPDCCHLSTPPPMPPPGASLDLFWVLRIAVLWFGVVFLRFVSLSPPSSAWNQLGAAVSLATLSPDRDSFRHGAHFSPHLCPHQKPVSEARTHWVDQLPQGALGLIPMGSSWCPRPGSTFRRAVWQADHSQWSVKYFFHGIL